MAIWALASAAAVVREGGRVLGSVWSAIRDAYRCPKCQVHPPFHVLALYLVRERVRRRVGAAPKVGWERNMSTSLSTITVGRCTHAHCDSSRTHQKPSRYSNKVAAEDESQKRLREVMTDNVCELNMGEMRQICEQEGIKLHTSV